MKANSKMIIVVVLLASLTACSPALFNTKQLPAGGTAQQQSLDEIQCGQMSQTNGPWLFGIGYAIYKSMAASTYKKCMETKGYQVQRAD